MGYGEGRREEKKKEKTEVFRGRSSYGLAAPSLQPGPIDPVVEDGDSPLCRRVAVVAATVVCRLLVYGAPCRHAARHGLQLPLLVSYTTSMAQCQLALYCCERAPLDLA